MTTGFDLAAAGVLLGVAAAVIVIVFGLTLVWARQAGHHRVVDESWGGGFALVAAAVAITAAALGTGNTMVQLVTTAMVVVWGVRLTAYLAWRNHGRGEDPRYAEMLGDDHPPGAITATVVRKVYLPQAAVMFVVSLPVVAAMVRTGTVLPLIVAGAVVWLVGFAFESVGDLQLQRFKADPRNKGEIFAGGLWRYTRHPNYFGDACVWWGVFLAAAGHPWALVTVVGPLVMTWLLVSVTGKELTEKNMSGRPGYADYVRRTSGFLPLPPGTKAARAT